MITENLKAKGSLSLVLTDENGNVKQSDTHNLVVDAGLAWITSRMVGTSDNAMRYMAVGSDGTAAAAAHVGLLSQISNRVALDSTTRVTTTATNDSVQYVCTFGAGVSTGAIQEAGLFEDTTGGSMLARTAFSVINKGALDTLTITWKITIA